MATRTVRTFVELWNGGTSKRAEKSESEAKRGDKIQDSATTLSTTTSTAALYRYSSWRDDDSDDEEALGALSDATILKRMGSFSSVHSLDTVDLSESDDQMRAQSSFQWNPQESSSTSRPPESTMMICFTRKQNSRAFEKITLKNASNKP